MSTPPKLPAAAQPAWETYLAMERSKHNHIDLLQQIEQQEKQGRARSFAQQVRLDRLLEQHDQAVLGFRVAMKRLGDEAPAVRDAFLEHLKQHNNRL